MISQIKLELYKIFKSKTTYLLVITLLIPIIFGLGMFARVSFLVNDGTENIDVISSQGISALEFAMNMMGQAHYITVFLFLIVSSILFAKEIEQRQINLYVVRVCRRGEIVFSKFFALTVVQMIYYVVFILMAFANYFLFVIHSKYGNGLLFSDNYEVYLLSFGIRFLGIMTITSINLCIGVRFKAFTCFAASFIFWFVSKYINFFDNIKMLVPDNFAEHVLKNVVNFDQAAPYLGLYALYIISPLLFSVITFQQKDLK